jgi:hypothetical protein
VVNIALKPPSEAGIDLEAWMLYSLLGVEGDYIHNLIANLIYKEQRPLPPLPDYEVCSIHYGFDDTPVVVGFEVEGVEERAYIATGKNTNFNDPQFAIRGGSSPNLLEFYRALREIPRYNREERA